MISRESSQDRLKKLEQIEKDLSSALASSGSALAEIAKEKPVHKQVENHSHNFLKGITQVERDLSEQIQYLTQVSSGQAHEGSSYAAQKVLAMAWHRLEHTKTRLGELERMTASHNIAPSHPPSSQPGPNGPAQAPIHPPPQQQQHQQAQPKPPHQLYFGPKY